MPDTQIGRTPQKQIVAETPTETPQVTPSAWGDAAWLGDRSARYGTLVSSRRVSVGHKLEMLCDPVIAFTMGYITTVLARARYRIECADESKRRFFEAMYGAVHREFTLQAAPAIALGCLGLIKKFEFAVPEPLETGAPPVWTSDITPYVLTGFDQIYPAGSRPIFKDGHFAGIERATGKPVDVFYALWLTRGREEAFGDYLGKGRLNNCYLDWWLKRFGCDLYVVYLQKNIDRVVQVQHPPGGIQNAAGEITKSYRDIAKDTGDAVRAGATVTLCSEPYINVDPMTSEERLTAIKKWAVSFLEGTQNVGAFHEMEDQRDAKMSLGMLIPPQAYLNVKQSALGGPTTADVLKEIAERLLLMDAIGLDIHLNEYVFPIVDKANFPPDSPPVKKVTYALADEDLATLRQIIKILMARVDVDVSKFDLEEGLTRLGMPLSKGVTDNPTDYEDSRIESAIALSHSPEAVSMTCPLCDHGEVDRYEDHGGLCVCRGCGCTFDPEVLAWPTMN